MPKAFSILVLVCSLLVPSMAFAQSGNDRVAFGHPVTVAAGEVVHDAVAFGGDTVVEGTVDGDAVSFGGDVVLRGDADVTGDTVAFGGTVRDERDVAERATNALTDGDAAESSPTHAQIDHEMGPFETLWSWMGEVARTAVLHVLLFLLGLLMIGVGRERLGHVQAAMIQDGVRTAGVGFLGYAGAIVAIVLLAITLIGIPAAIVVGLAMPIATYVGLAAAATVLGAALPIPQLKGNEIGQLGAGVAVLFLASLVPFAGGIFTAVIACLGVGALMRTKLGGERLETPPEAGPYRTATA